MVGVLVRGCSQVILFLMALVILFTNFVSVGGASSDGFCFGAGCHSEPGYYINATLFDNSSHQYLQCIDCHVNITVYPDVSHGDFVNTLMLPLSSSSYNSSSFSLCFGCHKESSLLGLEPVYSNYLWTHTLVPDYPLVILNISSNFINEQFSGHNFGNYPANIHWDHLDLHKIDAGAGPDLIWDSNHDGTLDSMVSCTTCHDPHGNTSGPNLTHDDLGIQHGTDEHGEYGEVTSIEYQRAGGDVYCVGCHGVGVKYYRPYRDVLNFSDLHISPVNMTGCIQSGCHYSNVLTVEHVEKRNLSCATCHQSNEPRVTDSIEQGNKSCFSCHTPHTTGSHLTHLESEKGPHISCPDCHGTQSPPLFADGETLENTTACNTCHSPGGTYDGVNDAEIGAKTNWNGVYNNNTLKPGKEKWCAGCHDSEPANISNEIAPNKAGDNTTYGYYITGHGRTDNYTRMSWQDTSATGNPGANQTCEGCHNSTSTHIVAGENPSTRRLKDGYQNDQNNTNCNNCHTTNGSATADPQFYTNSNDYEASAHGGKNCTECHEVHGAAGAYVAMTKGDKENLCFQCHTDGRVNNDALSNNRPGGYNSADDIQEAFSKSEKHNLGTSFTLSGGNYTLECISCHNIHIINGKYWDAEKGNKSPVTRFTDNTEVWGDETWEKMDDFAALASGTGGWYYKTAQGYALGSTGLPRDQLAVYQPPKNGSGYDFEFSGDILPDYATFCLDCHSSRVSAANPPINWGQGIGCTDNSVDPPDQRIECGAQHGLGAAGKPYYVSDSGTAGFWGSSGNPDVIFQMNYVTRGRHNGHFMRWPYDSADRSAGINFVLSCTDCHEAHGSNRGGMIRERFNVNANGDCGTGGNSNPDGENCNDGNNWNNFCNACHYYYGGQHAGMSCGSASCHEANSIHRIIHVTDSGAGTQLMLTAAGYETNYSRPDFTPEIDTVIGSAGSNELIVTFRPGQHGTGTQGIFTNENLTGTLEPEDFWLFDTNNNNPRTITNVSHTQGEYTATITMSAPLVAADFNSDLLATRGKSIWAWYEGGYNNYATGVILAQAVSAGPWPVTITSQQCPTGKVVFQLNESAGSTYAIDEEGVLNGTVNGTGTFAGDSYLHGDGTGSYIDFENNPTCLQATTTMTIETRIKPTGIGTDNYIKRILARDSNQNYQLSVWRNNNWATYNAPDGVASIALWVSPIDKHAGTTWKPVLTDYENYPIVSDHWYQVKVVWNSSKTGSIPADIFIDDQGTDGNNTGENWQGYKTATDSDQSQLPIDRYLYEGDQILTGDGDFTIGGNVNNHNNNVFNGLIDWITWDIIADYSNVDNP